MTLRRTQSKRQREMSTRCLATKRQRVLFMQVTDKEKRNMRRDGEIF